MKTYSAERKEALVRRTMPPENALVSALARETGITEQTLYTWRRQDKTTGIQIYDQAETCSSRHNVALLGTELKKNITVKASTPLSITMGVDRAIIPLPTGFIVRGCNPTVTFSPQNGASYIAELVTGNDMCSIKLTQISPDQTTVDVSEGAVKMRHWKRGFDESSSFCD
jgi:transposase-like protein